MPMTAIVDRKTVLFICQKCVCACETKQRRIRDKFGVNVRTASIACGLYFIVIKWISMYEFGNVCVCLGALNDIIGTLHVLAYKCVWIWPSTWAIWGKEQRWPFRCSSVFDIARSLSPALSLYSFLSLSYDDKHSHIWVILPELETSSKNNL